MYPPPLSEQNMIKRLIVLLLIIQSSFITACDQEVQIAYPPFVSLLTVSKFFSHFHQQLESEMDCGVNYVLNKSFDDVLDGLLEYRYNAVLLPGAYVPMATELGYELVSTLKRNNSIFIIARHDFKGDDYTDFAGLNILILDHFSASGARFEQALLDSGMHSKVTLLEGQSYERMMLSVMAGKADMAVIIPEYWALLSPDIRDKHLKIVKKMRSLSAGFVVPPDSLKFSKVLYQVLKNETVFTWGEPEIETEHLPLLDKYIKNRISETLGQ
jgi:ABC-type phosphate/phosphonate transport system substrate-binding protein